MLRALRKWLEASPGHHKWRSYAVSLPFGVILATCPEILLLGPDLAHADDMGVAASISTGSASALPYAHLEDYLSQPSETKVAFLTRVGAELRKYADITGFEACGAIASDGEHWGVVLGSNLSHVGCAIYPDKLPPGMSFTGESIHTHGRKGLNFIANDVDYRLMGLARSARMLRIQGEDVNHFSMADFAAPGYLATPNGLLYQNGRPNSERIVH